jgi:hypothetical protein
MITKKQVTALCSAVLLMFLLSPNIFAASVDDLSVGFIKEKRLTDDGKRVTYTIKCTVHNKGESSGEVFVTLQAVDRHGFELDEVLLTSDIRAKSKKTLSDKRRLSRELYKKVSKWKVKDVNFF